jgi:hypothetical protein
MPCKISGMTEAPIRDGQLIRPRMGTDGGYHMECCDCGLVHRLDFSITPENGLELRVYKVCLPEQTEVMIADARAKLDHASAVGESA